MYSSGKFSHLAGGDTPYDARGSPECKNEVDHAVNLGGAGSNYVTIVNSWGTDWGNKGLKKVIPCNENALLGRTNLITHTYADI